MTEKKGITITISDDVLHKGLRIWVSFGIVIGLGFLVFTSYLMNSMGGTRQHINDTFNQLKAAQNEMDAAFDRRKEEFNKAFEANKPPSFDGIRELNARAARIRRGEIQVGEGLIEVDGVMIDTTADKNEPYLHNKKMAFPEDFSESNVNH